jgi:gamma-glutamylcyclotransferase (GGCT)/AIG2-like uncharacterized protein YtfP
MTNRTVDHLAIFAYGTLQRGEINHRLLDGSRFLGEAATEPEFTLINMGAFPAMVEDGTTAVKGEVYQVDASTLAELDHLEGHPVFYRRRMITLADGRHAIAYVMPPERAAGRPVIEHGDWRLHLKELRK